MAAVTTGTDLPSGIKRKERKINFTVDTENLDSDTSPLLPTAQRSPFTHEFPIEEYAARAHGWALPGIGLPNLGVFSASFAHACKLHVGIAVFLCRVVDTTVNSLRYPLLGLLIFTFINEHFSDSHLRPASIVTKTTTVTATSMTTSYLNSATTVLTASSLTPLEEISTPPTLESSWKVRGNTQVQGFSSAPATSEASETKTAPSSRAKVGVPAIASKLDELKSSSAIMGSKLSAVRSSAASSSTVCFPKKVLAAARIVPLSGKAGDD